MGHEEKVVANLRDGTRATDSQPIIENPVVLDGKPQIVALRRPDIKLNTKPEIVIALPCGMKEVGTVYQCPKDQGGCGQSWHHQGFRHPHLVPFQWTIANMQMVPPLNCTMAYLVESGRLSAEARQVMTKEALRMGAKYILYWDDDTIPPRWAFIRSMYGWRCIPRPGLSPAFIRLAKNPPCR